MQSSSTLATSCKELTQWKRLWCWEGLGAGGEGDGRGWDGWMASLTRWSWVSVNSGSWWWTGKPGVLRFMGSQRVGHDWATELNWTLVKLLLVNISQSLKASVTSCFIFQLNGAFDFYVRHMKHGRCLKKEKISLEYYVRISKALPVRCYTEGNRQGHVATMI